MLEKATFAAGCFWHVEAAFCRLKGVDATTAGYTGGTAENPGYEQVCAGKTGHAEAVQVEFNPSEVSYDELLDLFWRIHDPTTLNRQGPDIGAQYRSAIFYHTPEQHERALTSRDRLDKSGKLRRPIVTQLVEAGRFFLAEEYHQRYLEKHGASACPLP